MLQALIALKLPSAFIIVVVVVCGAAAGINCSNDMKISFVQMWIFGAKGLIGL